MGPICRGDAALNHSKRRGHGSLNWNEKNAAFGFMKGRRFQDATFESALDATSQASHATRLKDLVGPLNAKSALTIRDLCPSIFPEASIHASALHWASPFVRELKPMALIFTPLITGLMAGL